MSRRSRAWRAWPVLGLGVVHALAGPGCVATTAVVATVVLVRMLTPHGYKLTIKAEQRPRELYNDLVALLRARHPELRVIQQDAAQRFFEAEWMAAPEPGVAATTEWVSMAVQTLPDESSELVIAMGNGRSRTADYREWTLARIDAMMEELGVAWRIAAGPSDATFAHAPGHPLPAAG